MSWLLVLETRPTWYAPVARMPGWHMRLFKLMGTVDFMLFGALDFAFHYLDLTCAPPWPLSSGLGLFS